MLTATLCGVAAIAVFTPPCGGAAVADWFGSRRAEVRYDPSATPSSGAHVPGCFGVPVPGAGRAPGRFRTAGPHRLGPPTGSRSPGSRATALCSLCAGGTADDTARRVSRAARHRLLRQDGSGAASIGSPVWARRRGCGSPASIGRASDAGRGRRRWDRSERVAGPTLLWTSRGEQLTLRLEGVTSRSEALKIAKSGRVSSTVEHQAVPASFLSPPAPGLFLRLCPRNLP